MFFFNLLQLLTLDYTGRDMTKGVFEVNTNSKDQNQPAEIYQTDQERCYSSLCYVPNDSISGSVDPNQNADAQADLGLRCPFTPKDMFSHDLTQRAVHLLH